MEKFSIKKGYDQVQRQHLEIVKAEIMSILGINSRTQWSSYIRGDVEPAFSKAQAIAAIFESFGIMNYTESEDGTHQA